MAIKSRLMGVGLSAGQAEQIVGDTATGLTATGSAITDALRLTAAVNCVTTTASSTGVILPGDTQPGDEISVFNDGAQTLTVYPPASTQEINDAGDGAGHSVAANKGASYRRLNATQWMAILTA